MNVNNYGSLIEPWKVELIKWRARYFGFCDNEIQDIQQDLVLKLMGFVYDANNSKGAKERTVLQVVIDNDVKMRCRFQERQRKMIESMQWITDLACNSPNVLLSMDTENAIHSLPKVDRQICVALSEGYSTSEIACALQVSRRTIQRHILKIGAYFKSLNLHQWLTQ